MVDYNQVGSMWGERAIQAPFAAIVTKTSEIDGVKRAMFGGVVLADIGSEGWQRWRGTMILIPRMIDKTRKPCVMRMDQMVTDPLSWEIAEHKRVPRDSFWVPEWRPSPVGEG